MFAGCTAIQPRYGRSHRPALQFKGTPATFETDSIYGRSGISGLEGESFYQKTLALPRRVICVEKVNDQFKAFRRCCGSLSGNGKPCTRTSSHPGARRVRILPSERGFRTRSRSKRVSWRDGIGTYQQLVCERAGQTLCTLIDQTLRARPGSIGEVTGSGASLTFGRSGICQRFMT
jgi:hypothetical protein